MNKLTDLKKNRGLSAEALKRFAADLRTHTGVKVAVRIDRKPEGMHVLRINGVDFFFYADGSGYDGWGKCVNRPS